MYSSFVNTLPVGLWGEFITIALVLELNVDFNKSQFTSQESFSVNSYLFFLDFTYSADYITLGYKGTDFAIPPAICI